MGDRMPSQAEIGIPPVEDILKIDDSQIDAIIATLRQAQLKNVKILAGPAWSLLLECRVDGCRLGSKALNNILSLSFEISSFLQKFESKITLKPLDLDKQLVNLLSSLTSGLEDNHHLFRALVHFLIHRLNRRRQSDPQLDFMAASFDILTGSGQLDTSISICWNNLASISAEDPTKGLSLAVHLAKCVLPTIEPRSLWLNSKVPFSCIEELARFIFQKFSDPKIEQSVEILQQMYPDNIDDIVFMAVAERPIKHLVEFLTGSRRKYGLLLYNTNCLLRDQFEHLDLCAEDISGFADRLEARTVLVKIQQRFQLANLETQRLLCRNALFLIPIAQCKSAMRNKFGLYFGHFTVQFGLFAELREFIMASGAENASSLGLAAAGSLLKASRYEDALWFISKSIESDTTIHRIPKLDCLAICQRKLGKFNECRETLTSLLELYLGSENYDENKLNSVLTKWCNLPDTSGIPALNNRVFEVLLEFSFSFKPKLMDCLLSRLPLLSQETITLYLWKHRRATCNWRDSKIEDLCKESRLILSTIKDEQWTISSILMPIFLKIASLWNYAMQQTFAPPNARCNVAWIDEGIQKLLTLWNFQDDESHSFAESEQAMLKGDYVTTALQYHRETNRLREEIRHAADIFEHAYLSHFMLLNFSSLTRCYIKLGSFRHAKLYAEQAVQLASLICPLAPRTVAMKLKLEEVLALADEASSDFEVDGLYAEYFNALRSYSYTLQLNQETTSLKFQAMQLRPFDPRFPDESLIGILGKQPASKCDGFTLYTCSDSMSDEIKLLAWQAYTHCSPWVFQALCFSFIRDRSVSTEEARGLLNLANYNIFECRHKADLVQSHRDKQTVTIPYDTVAFENWETHILQHSLLSMSNCLGFTYDPINNCLMIQIQRELASPILAIIPAGNADSHSNLKTEIETIMAENKETLFGHSKQNEGHRPDFDDPQVKRAWWKTRQVLDRRLAELATKIDQEWLAPIKTILTKPLVSKDFIIVFSSRLATLFNAPYAESSLQILTEFFVSFRPFPNAKTLDFLLATIERSFKVSFDDRLKALRILRKCFEETFEEENIFLTFEENGMNELVLIVDKYLHLFPWEMTESLKSMQVYRQPSTWHLRRQSAESLDANCIGYVLNPGGDLKRTEELFVKRLASLNLACEGVVGRPPEEGEFASFISAKDLFLYFGHGGGDAYISSSRIRRLCKCSPSFLIGCSSGKVKPYGKFCPEATFLNYLYAGCPLILVNLWDVTDKDIDQFTDSLFDNVGLWPSDEPKPIGEAVKRARQSCFMRYLNGAAPVVYGLPIDLRIRM